MIEFSLFVLLNEPFDELAIEVRSAFCRGVEEGFAQRLIERTAEPRVERNAEARLGPRVDFVGKEIGARLPQNVLAAFAAQFIFERDLERELRYVRVEQGRARFERAAHRRDIDFRHDIAREIGQDVGERNGACEIAAREFRPCGAQETDGVARFFVGGRAFGERLLFACALKFRA